MNENNGLKAMKTLISSNREFLPNLDDRYILLIKIGEGRFGKVKLGYDLIKKRFVAIKILKKSAGPKIFNLFLREVEYLITLKNCSEICQILDFNFEGVIKCQTERKRVMYYST